MGRVRAEDADRGENAEVHYSVRIGRIIVANWAIEMYRPRRWSVLLGYRRYVVIFLLRGLLEQDGKLLLNFHYA